MSARSESESGDTVLVAGASSGIGRAVAETVAASGRRVVLFARRGEALAEVADQIRAAGGIAEHVVGDAADASACAEAVGAASSGASFVAAVNCVGTNIRQRSLPELTDQGWAAVMRDNLDAAYQLTRAVVPVFRDRAGGLLVHIASRAVHAADGSGVAYQAAKAGVAALAHATAVEEQDHGVRVSVVYPGLTDTRLVLQRPVPPSAEELGRALQPSDVAQVVQLLIDLPPRAHIPDVSVYPSG